ncbi:MAG: hypothetical protein LC799_33220, partial [Actinobacteria bacterium]|nr:hypothetical protein [Actinomycetota bacterium]
SRLEIEVIPQKAENFTLAQAEYKNQYVSQALTCGLVTTTEKFVTARPNFDGSVRKRCEVDTA